MFLKTQRLLLRNLRPEDVPEMWKYRSDPECAKYQRWEDTSISSVAQIVETYRDCVFLSEQEEQHYAICGHDDVLMGELSYFFTERDQCVTLGITIAPAHQRKGIAREILETVVAAVQARYPALDIVALIDPENTASIRLFESLGFCRECYAESIRSYVYVIDGKRA